jgi:hypothetical protein
MRLKLVILGLSPLLVSLPAALGAPLPVAGNISHSASPAASKQYVSSLVRQTPEADGRPLSATDETASPKAHGALPSAPEELLERAVRTFFSEDGSCHLSIESRSHGDALQGKFSSFRLQVGATTVKGMQVESAVVELENFAVDLPQLRATGKIRVFSAERMSYRLSIPEQGLNWLLSGNKRLGKDKPPRLELKSGHVVLSGRIKTELLNTAFRLKGKLATRHEREVHFVPDSMSVGWLALPSFLMDFVAGRVNPVATVDKMLELQRCNLRIRDISVSPGVLTVSG